MMQKLVYILLLCFGSASAGSWADLSKPNNWNDSIKRWSRGDGAWNNWRDWGKNGQGKRTPWNAITDMGADMAAEAMGDAVTEVEFEWWVKANFKAKAWYKLDQESKYNVYNYWRNYIQPVQQYQQEKNYAPEYQQPQTNQGYYPQQPQYYYPAQPSQ